MNSLTLRLHPDRASVDAWYNAAIEAGAKDNGKPGIRSHYHAHYYGAFVIVSDNLAPTPPGCVGRGHFQYLLT